MKFTEVTLDIYKNRYGIISQKTLEGIRSAMVANFKAIHNAKVSYSPAVNSLTSGVILA
jgi:hypothetical protein